MSTTVACTICEELKPVEAFSYRDASHQKRRTECKRCNYLTYRNPYNKTQKGKLAQKRSRLKNKENFKAYIQTWNSTAKGVISRRESLKRYRSKPEILVKNRLQDRARQPQRTAREAQRYQDDLEFRLKKVLRSRLRSAIQREFKAGSAVRDLQCSIPELRTWLEHQWKPGMTWENWGKGAGTWQIDHVKPLASFDLTKREELLRACCFLNLQPLWTEENLRKGASCQ